MSFPLAAERCYSKTMGLGIFTKAFWKALFSRELPKPKFMSEEAPSQKKQSQSSEPKPELKEKLEEKPNQRSEPKIKAQEKVKSVVRSELNLEQYSIFTVSTYRKKSREITVREVLPTGEVNERKAIIGKTAKGVETGVLDVHHFKVYLVLLELWEKAGRPIHEPVHFTILKIIKRLGLVDSGRNFEIIKRHLLDLRQIPITFINSFFIPKEGSFKSLEPFTILGYLDIYERKKKSEKQKVYGYGEFKFDDHILANLINNYSHPIQLDIVREFKKHKDLAILLYVYLDRNLAFKDKYEVKLEKLFEHLDLSQSHVKYPSGRKRVIAPVLKELEGKELSTGILSYCRIHKTEDGKDYKLVAHKKPFQRLPKPEREAPPQLSAESDLMATLKAHGLTETQIREFLPKGEEWIRHHLEIFPFKVQWYQSRGLKVKNPAALLYMQMKGDWPPPANYLEAKKAEEAKRMRADLIYYECPACPKHYNNPLIIGWRKSKGELKSCPACGGPVRVVGE